MVLKESEKIELKETLGEWREIIITLGAMANKKGGKIVVGLKDNGEPLEIEFPTKSIDDIVNKIKQNTDPQLYPSVNPKTFGTGEILEIEVKESDFKPVFAFDKAYLRVGSTNQKMSGTEIRETIKRYDIPKFAEQKSGVALKDVQLDKKITASLGKDYLTVLENLDLTDGTQLTNAGYLCLCAKNTKYLNAHVKVGRFKENTMSVFLDQKELESNLVKAVTESVDFIKKNTRLAFELTGEPAHKEKWEYPITALREALINALIHRDYHDPGNIQIRIFDTRLEIWSPGLLPKELSVTNLENESRSIPKNKVLYKFFKHLKLIEGWGSGFKRMIEESIAYGCPKPLFEEKAGAFVTSFFPMGVKEGVNEGVNEGVKEGVKEGVNELEKLTENQQEILTVLQREPTLTTEQLSDKVGINIPNIEKNLAKLKTKSRLIRVGSDKSGYWKVLT